MINLHYYGHNQCTIIKADISCWVWFPQFRTFMAVLVSLCSSTVSLLYCRAEIPISLRVSTVLFIQIFSASSIHYSREMGLLGHCYITADVFSIYRLVSCPRWLRQININHLRASRLISSPVLSLAVAKSNKAWVWPTFFPSWITAYAERTVRRSDPRLSLSVNVKSSSLLMGGAAAPPGWFTSF